MYKYAVQKKRLQELKETGKQQSLSAVRKNPIEF